LSISNEKQSIDKHIPRDFTSTNSVALLRLCKQYTTIPLSSRKWDANRVKCKKKSQPFKSGEIFNGKRQNKFGEDLGGIVGKNRQKTQIC
jgi:hypothetical protein